VDAQRYKFFYLCNPNFKFLTRFRAIMIVKDFLQLYKSDGIVQTISQQISVAEKGSLYYIKGLCGALDTVLIAA